MLQPNMVRILATAMVGVVCGIASPLVAQDDPFAAAAPAEPASPFGGAAPAAPEAASPFGDAAPPAEANDPFATAPAAPTTTFQPSFGTAPAAPPADAAAAPDAATATAPAPPASDDPFGAVTAPEAAPISSPFGGPAAPVNVDAMAGGPAPAAPEGGAAPAATNTGKGIAQLFEFRYIPSATFNGKKVVTRKQLTKEEAAAFDASVIAEFGKLATDDKLPNKAFNKTTNTAQEWGQWLLYAHQLDNWTIYCRDVALAGSSNKTDPEEDIHWPGDPKKDEAAQGAGQEVADAGGGKGGGSRPPRPTNIYNENRSLDDQVTDFFSVPDTRQGTQGRQVIDPKQMDDQAKKLYDAFLTDLREVEKKQTAFVKKLQNDIAQRQRDREGYQEWRDNQKRIVMDYVEEWNRRYEGRIVTVAGVRYEMYKPGTEPTNATRFANIVVTDYDLTPYDLLNEDGTLRGPAR